LFFACPPLCLSEALAEEEALKKILIYTNKNKENKSSRKNRYCVIIRDLFYCLQNPTLPLFFTFFLVSFLHQVTTTDSIEKKLNTVQPLLFLFEDYFSSALAIAVAEAV
jgi:hypothetical protein